MSCIRCSQIALRSVRARRSGLCANADGRPERRAQRRVRAGPRLAGDSGGVGRRPRRRPSTTCSSARPRLPLRALCAPPSPARWRRAPLARARRFAPGVLRCRPRAGSTLPSRAAAALRVVRHPCAGGAPLLPARLAVPAAHFLPYICFVSALCQSIAAFVGLSTAICRGSRGSRLPSSCQNSADGLLQGMGCEPPTNTGDYRSKSSPVRSKSIAHIAHFRPLR